MIMTKFAVIWLMRTGRSTNASSHDVCFHHDLVCCVEFDVKLYETRTVSSRGYVTEKVGLKLMNRFESIYESAIEPTYQDFDHLQFDQSYWWNTEQQPADELPLHPSNQTADGTSTISMETANQWRALKPSFKQ